MSTVAGSGNPKKTNEENWSGNAVALGTPVSVAVNNKTRTVYFVEKDSFSIRKFANGMQYK